jgi:hypothetical protein
MDETRRGTGRPPGHLVYASPAGTKFIVQMVDPGVGPIEITFLGRWTDKVLTREVLLKDGKNFPEPTEVTFIGSYDGDEHWPGGIGFGWQLSFEVGGKVFGEEYSKVKDATMSRPPVPPGEFVPLWPWDMVRSTQAARVSSMDEPRGSLARPLGFSVLTNTADTKYVVQMVDLGVGPIEITVVNGKSGKVLVKDEKNFPEPTEATFIGSHRDGKSKPGLIMFGWFLSFEVGGKVFGDEYGKVKDATRSRPSEKPGTFELWPW